MVTEIVNNEIFLKVRHAKWRKVRFVLYLLAFLVVFALPFLPIPFAPEILHDIFGGRNGGLVTAFVVLLFIPCLIILFFVFLYELVFHRRLNKLLLLEVLAVPLFLTAFLFLSEKISSDIPQKIVLRNKNRQPEEFSNPYLGYKMLDCRNITEEFDVIFIPQHFGIETEYLAYAPRRKNKTIDYIPGKKYGNDWYWEFSGSQWSDDFRNCRLQNKSPNP